jgi:hypothetical protein
VERVDGLDSDKAKAIVVLIASGLLPHVSINY